MAYIIKTNGEKSNVTPKNGEDVQLEEMQEIVGGYIEIVRLDEKTIMVVNEEGLVYNLPYNAKASRLCGIPIVGDVLVCESKMVR